MTRASKVVFFAPHAPGEHGGVANATWRIAQQAAARGEEVHLVCWSKHAPPGGCVTRERHGRGEALDSSEEPSSEDQGRSEKQCVFEHHVGRQGDLERDLMALVEHGSSVLQRSDADLVHAIYGSDAGYAGVLAAQLAGVASLLSLRGNDVDRGLFRTDQFHLLKHAVENATLVSGVSREICMKAGRAFNRSVNHVTNSVDARVFKPEEPDNSLRAALDLEPGAKVLGFVGELREKKGMRFLLPAFAELSRGAPLHLLLIGGVRRDAQRAYAAFEATAPDAAARIKLLEYSGSPKRLCRLLALCDLVVFPSLFEGTPNAALEAMAAARPVLATRVGGHIDIIEHGVTGALLDTHDLDQLPDAMQECLESAERLTWGKRARNYVLQAHAPSLESETYERLYAEARAAKLSPLT
ncbi:MAG: glycosyltransferase [Polyangiaceae bacterium]|nr:glycosyltransferase [Polyangiaceae bacterium]MCB9607955.1 glycosyltransferase [Polyangiaceae bacterium]